MLVTASRPDRLLPVDIDGDIDLESPAGRTLRLAARGATMQLSVPHWQDLQSLGPRSLFAQRRSLVAAARLLMRLNVGLAIDVANRPVLHIGPGAKTSLLARLLGVSNASIGFATAIKLLTTRRNA